MNAEEISQKATLHLNEMLSEKEDRLEQAEKLVLDFVLADIQDPRPEVEELKRKAREFLNGKIDESS